MIDCKCYLRRVHYQLFHVALVISLLRKISSDYLENGWKMFFFCKKNQFCFFQKYDFSVPLQGLWISCIWACIRLFHSPRPLMPFHLDCIMITLRNRFKKWSYHDMNIPIMCSKNCCLYNSYVRRKKIQIDCLRIKTSSKLPYWIRILSCVK